MLRKDKILMVAGLIAGTAAIAKGARRRRAMTLANRVALITGGSRGLGLLIARELGRAGARVILIARDEAELERAKHDLASEEVDASVIVTDVRSESDAHRAVSGVIASHGRLDVLVNNAGVITVGPLDHMTPDDFAEAMGTHFWGPLYLMRSAIPEMRRLGGGRIANISSIGGEIAVPHLTPYCASKFALTGLSDSVRSEVARDGILVTTVCPGLMRTGSPFNARFKGKYRDEFAWFAIADSLPVLSISGRRAAAQIVDAIRHGDAKLIITWPARLAVIAGALLPNTVARTIAVVNRLLPARAPSAGVESHSGWQSSSSWAPSALTRLSERAAAANNELPPRPNAGAPVSSRP
jgi:NAD(P)-dependent dehydrogenase (short-subunit alcohol dehydrogenase family)